MKKKILSFFLVLMVLTSAVAVFAAVPASGSSAANPILIKDSTGLAKINQAPGKFYKLAADIDVSDYNYGDWKPLENFTGCLDGNGHTINNLMVTKGYVPFVGTGLFKENKGIIKNLNIKGADFICNGYNNYKMGFVAGINSGKIIDVHVSGVIENTYCYDFGGIAGDNSGLIQECTSDLTIDNIKSSVMKVGGITGDNSKGTVSSCISTVHFTVVGCMATQVGGIAGAGNGMIENCIVNGMIDIQHGMQGGFEVGLICTGGIVKNCLINATIDAHDNKVESWASVGDSVSKAGTPIKNVYRTPSSKVPDDASVFAVMLNEEKSKTKSAYQGFSWFSDYSKGIDGFWDIKEGQSIPTLVSRYGIPEKQYSYSYNAKSKVLTLSAIREKVTFTVKQGSKLLTSKTTTLGLKKCNISLAKLPKGTKVSFYVTDEFYNQGKIYTITL